MADPAITETVAEISVSIGRSYFAIVFARVLAITHRVCECVIGTVFIASQTAVLAACGRYMGWW
jgi:hypothetical protein